MILFEAFVTAEGAEAAIAHLDAFSEGSGSENVSELRLPLLYTGPSLPNPLQFITHESFFHYESDVIYFFLFLNPNFFFFHHFVSVGVCMCLFR